MATRRPPNAGFLKKEPTETHAAFSEFIEKTTGHAVPVGDVALVQRLYPLYLKSPAVVKAKEAEAKRKAEEAEKKAAEKKARVEERLARLEEQRRRLLASIGADVEDEQESKEGGSVLPFPKPKAAEDPEPEDEVVLIIAEDDFVVADEDDESDWDEDEDEEEDF